MLEMLFDYEGEDIIHYKFISEGQLSIKNFIWTFLNDEVQSNKNDQKNGEQMIGFYHITVLHHHITLSLEKKTLPDTVLLLWNTFFIFLT